MYTYFCSLLPQLFPHFSSQLGFNVLNCSLVCLVLVLAVRFVFKFLKVLEQEIEPFLFS